MIDVKNSPYIFGIDLGTTNSVISVYQGGKPLVIEIDGNVTTPSVVRFKEEDKQVGEMAKRAMMIDPENTISSIKRKMGDRDYSVEMFGQSYNPIEISSYILDHLKLKASEQDKIDLKGNVLHAIICRPANFNANQIEDTRKAAEIAGFEKVWLLEEPVAAAIAYGYNKGEEQNLLIYDLGGGTFDVCILHTGKDSKGNNTYEVLSTEGIQDLGGDDFDQKIVEVLVDQLREKSGIDIQEEEKDQGVNLKRIRTARQTVKEAAEKAKKELSEQEISSIIIADVIADEGGTSHSIECDLSRKEFDDMIRDLIYRSKDCIETALSNASMKIEDVSRILLVGGSTRVPLVRTMIEEMFGEDPWRDIDPMLCVAEGASVKGSSLLADILPVGEEGIEEEDLEKDQEVKTITDYNLGIEVRGGKLSTIIEKGVEAPASQAKLYSVGPDNPSTVRISIYQAPDDVEYVSDEAAMHLGEFYLTDIPAVEKDAHRIEVTFQLNEENALNVSAICTTADGIENELKISRD